MKLLIFHPRIKKHVILASPKIEGKSGMNSHMILLTTLEWNEVILVSVKGKQERGIDFMPKKKI